MAISSNGVDFRNTTGYVADPAGHHWSTGSSYASSPGYGWLQSIGFQADNSSSINPVLAGNTNMSSKNVRYRQDLANGGYAFRLASNSQSAGALSICIWDGFAGDGATALTNSNAFTYAALSAVAAARFTVWNGNLYYTTAGGTTGAVSPPTHTSGSVGDGTVSWTYIKTALLWLEVASSSGIKDATGASHTGASLAAAATAWDSANAESATKTVTQGYVTLTSGNLSGMGILRYFGWTAQSSPDHATSGALTGQAPVLAGSAFRTRAHAADGGPTGGGSALVGMGTHSGYHDTSGTLVSAAALVTGTSARTRQHPSSGVLTGGGSALGGDVSRKRTLATSGSLFGGSALLAGAAARTTAHLASGLLGGSGATVDGAATRTRPHLTSGSLAGGLAGIVGETARLRVHTAVGTPVGGIALLIGSATRSADHPVNGELVGADSSLAGHAERTPAEGLIVRPDRLISGDVRTRIIPGETRNRIVYGIPRTRIISGLDQ